MSRKATKDKDGPPTALREEPHATHTAHSPAHEHVPKFLGGFLDKLKRRNVGRVAILYIVVCYLILEPFEMFFHLLDLPVWTGRTVVFVMVLGFPAALLFAWIYEITPEGIKPSGEVNPGQSIARQTGRKLDRAIIAVLAVAVVYFVADKFWISKRVVVVAPTAAVAPPAVSAPAGPVIPEKSVAVLPFVDMSEKKDQEYFSDGLSEELIDLLSKVPDLRVPARTSSFYFKEKSEDIPTIARKLMVANVLEGSVRKSGRNLRITVQLVRADTGYHIWSKTYDRKLEDIFKIQDEVAEEIVNTLKIELPGNLKEKAATLNSEAYLLYLQAHALTLHFSAADQTRAVELLHQALKLDPRFAIAWAELAIAQIRQAQFGEIPEDKARDEARKSAQTAINLDSTLAASHVAMAKVFYMFDWNWEAASAETQQALRLDPALGDALRMAGVISKVKGHLDEATILLRQAVNIDPLNALNVSQLAETMYYLGNYSDAALAAHKAIELAPPTGFGANYILPRLLLGAGRPAEALASFERLDDEWSRKWGQALAYFALGRRPEADHAVAELEKGSSDSPYIIAEVHAYRGEIDQSFAWLERAYGDRDNNLVALKADPLLQHLRADPRYSAFLRKMKLSD